MLTGKQTPRQVQIPHEPGSWMQFRRLPWPLLLAAEQARQKRALKNLAENLEDDVVDVLNKVKSEVDRSDRKATPKAERDFEELYDRGIILHSGIAAWSYGDEVTRELIDDLDEQTADWAFREILRPSVRSEEERTDRFFPVAQVP